MVDKVLREPNYQNQKSLLSCGECIYILYRPSCNVKLTLSLLHICLTCTLTLSLSLCVGFLSDVLNLVVHLKESSFVKTLSDHEQKGKVEEKKAMVSQKAYQFLATFARLVRCM